MPALGQALRWSLISLAALLLTVATLAGGFWLWAGSDGSLASSLQFLQHTVLSDQALEARGVTGSLRQGGRIGALNWQQDGLSVQASEIQITWQPSALWQGELHLSQLSVAHLSIQDQRVAVPNAPAAPPAQLGLPFKVDAQVQVGTLVWQGARPAALEQVSFHYIFNSYSHLIEKGYGLFSSNEYAFSGELQAQAPMALKGQISGLLPTQIPGRMQPVNLAAQAALTGALAGPQARLTLQATLIPQYPADQPPPPAQIASPGRPEALVMQARLSAEIAPWQAQKIVRAHGQWQSLDLAALWPQAPQTRLTGEATVTPQDTRWLASITLRNSLSGPWNQQRLPLQSLNADVTYTQGQWLLQSLQASGAGGSMLARGQLNTPLQGDPVAKTRPGLWQVQATLSNINPAAIDTRFGPERLNGSLSAHQVPDTATSNGTGIVFDLALQAQAGPKPPQSSQTLPNLVHALRLQRLAAHGLWSAPLLTLQSLVVDAHEAQIKGQLSVHTQSLALQGQLQAHIPGLQATLDGHLSSRQGAGTLSLQMPDAALALRWLSRFPAVASTLSGTTWHGNATVNARWSGGWQHNAQDLQINASLRAPQLDWVAAVATADTLHLTKLQMDVTGSPAQLSVSGHSALQRGQQHLDWQTQASAVRGKEGRWLAHVNQLQLALQNGTHTPPWRLQLDPPTPATAPVTLSWQPGSATSTFTMSPGFARLQGPSPGTARLSWQTLRWTTAAALAARKSNPVSWQSQGRIDDLPLTWVDALGGQSLADLGLSSDMLLSGTWDAEQADQLHLNATLERRSGDLRLHTDIGSQSVVSAGMAEAWMQLTLDGEQLAASLRWDSLRAGRALLAFGTQLRHPASGWTWSDSAPVAGSLQLQLPPVDAWSALAPPGWRLRGTVNSHINLSGTLDAPQWNGTLQARDLALRSVVDGVDFSGGTLDARLHGQQLDLERFTLQGAGAAPGVKAASPAGGQIAITGSVFWRPGLGQSDWRARIQMALQAQLNALRLSSRPDRRMVVSGKLTADLKASQLTLRGALSADQALITLPDDSAPSLSDDVVVRRPTPPSTPSQVAARQPPQSPTNPHGPRLPVDVWVDLDLGPDFQVRGRGLQARLVGKLALSAKDGHAPTLGGNVRTASGTYRAYGQQLVIERGVLRFTGPIDNPALTILAIRPNLSQRVGVQISGTALSPIVLLYAEPDLPEAEKLAWLVLGRSASGGGAEAALLQQAALALLGGNGKNLSSSLSQALGLDELSLRGNSNSGESASAASVTLGKRLSSNFYVTYESSLNGAMGVFYIFYDLSQRLTLRAQAGEQSALDLIWTQRYD